MNRIAICTLFARNHLTRGRVLANSLRDFHPEIDFYALVTDAPDDQPLNVPPGTFGLRTSDVIDIADRDWMAGMYGPLEFCAAFKPFLIEHLLGRGYQIVIYLDSDMYVTGPLDWLFTAAERASVTLTPHLFEPLELDGKVPEEANFLLAGTFNTGLIGATKTEWGERAIAWWKSRLRNRCLDDSVNGIFVDQRWADLIPGMFDGVGVIRHPGVNAAYWNLRPGTMKRRGRQWKVSGAPLLVFHFSGFDPDRPYILSRWQDRIDATDYPVLAELTAEYAAALKAADFDGASRTPYAFAQFSNGVRVTKLCRQLLRNTDEFRTRFPKPLQAEGGSSFFSWLHEPVWQAPDGRRFSRYLQLLYESDAALQAAFPDPLGRDHDQWMGWLAANEEGVWTRTYRLNAAS